FFQAEDGIRDRNVTGVQTCALPIWAAEQAQRRERSRIGSVPPLRGALARRRSVTSVAGPAEHLTLPALYFRAHGVGAQGVRARVCAWGHDPVAGGTLGVPLVS